MRFLIIAVFISTTVFAESVEQRIQALEARVRALEAKAGGSVDASSGLRVKDMGNSQIKNSVGSRDVSSTGPSLTKEQQDELKETIENYKKQQAESQKLLDELMNEP